ncbi:MAG: ATP-dependent Clp protease adaptor ClpS [Phycisphaerales bacterium]
MSSEVPPAPPTPPSTPAPDNSTHGAASALLDRPPPRQLPPFKVLLHNDDVNTPQHVVQSLVEHTPLEPQRATLVMKEAHDSGLALVLVTHRERAELYREQLQSKSLTVTIEPV